MKGGKKNNKKNVASLGASLPIAFLKGWIIIQIELAFFSYTVQLKSFLCRIFMIIHLFLSWAESLAQEAVVQMKGIVSGKMGFVKVGLSDKPYPQQLPKNIFKPFKGA